MVKTIVAFGAGAAAGYLLARVLEARSAGIPVGLALQLWDVPVGRLLADQAGRARPVRQLDPDAPMRPAWMTDEG